MTTSTKTFGGLAPQTADIKGFVAKFVNFAALYRQRRALERLDAHLLDDLGLTEVQAKEEASRPVWDVPTNWRA